MLMYKPCYTIYIQLDIYILLLTTTLLLDPSPYMGLWRSLFALSFGIYLIAVCLCVCLSVCVQCENDSHTGWLTRPVLYIIRCEREKPFRNSVGWRERERERMHIESVDFISIFHLSAISRSNVLYLIVFPSFRLSPAQPFCEDHPPCCTPPFSDATPGTFVSGRPCKRRHVSSIIITSLLWYLYYAYRTRWWWCTGSTLSTLISPCYDNDDACHPWLD